MPNGRTLATASITLSGVSPPARRIFRCAATALAPVQSMVRPVPPRFTGSCTSSSRVVLAGHAPTRGSSTGPNGTALMTGLDTAAAYSGVSSPWSCTAPSRRRLATAFTYCSG